MRLQGLRRQLLDGVAVLLQLAIGGDQLLSRLLGLANRADQRLNSGLDLLEALGLPVDRAQPRRQLIEPRRRPRRLFVHVLQGLPHLCELRAL